MRTNVSPKRRIAQMPDMRGLVRIDVGVLDDDLLAGTRRLVRRRRASSASAYAARSSRMLM